MKLGIDVTALSESWGGMQYFTANLVRSLLRATGASVTLLRAGENDGLKTGGSHRNVKSVTLPSISTSRVVREQLTLPVTLAAGGYDLDRLLVPAYFGPIITGPSVDMIVHDLLYLRDDSGHGLKDRAYWKGLYRAAFYRAGRLYPCSRATRDEMIERMPWASGKVGPVLYPGHRRYDRTGEDPVHRDTNDPFILYVGTISPRKNVGELLDFYRSAPASISDQYDLRLVGEHGWGEPGPDALKRAGEGVIWEGRVSDARLRTLYEEASLLVLPSRGEGFGMPILEAFRHRLPVVLSPLDVFREVAGDAAWYLPSFRQDEGWVEVISEALTDGAARRLKTTKGIRRSRRFSWARSAKRYLNDIASGEEA